MSRAFKNRLVDDSIKAGATGLAVAGVNAEKLSGADLEQVRLAAMNLGAPAVDAAGTKTLGGNIKASVLATVTADAANTVTVDTTQSLYVGQVVDILSAAGVSRADNRTITVITPAGVVTYNGADASASIIATDVVVDSLGVKNNAALDGAAQERYAGDQ